MSLKSLSCSAALAAVLFAAPALAQTAWPALGTPPKPVAQLPALPAVATQWNGVWNLVGGLMFDPAHSYTAPDPANGAGFSYGPQGGSRLTGIPYTAAAQKEYDDTIKQAEKGIVTDPMGSCILPHGMPRIMGGGPGPMELVVQPNQIWMIFDYMNETRRIYTDGRGHHGPADAFPLVMGHSIGRWEGDTLVADSTEMTPGIFDRTGAPHSNQVHLMERMRLVDPNTLEVVMTIEDPVKMTAPWHVTRQFRRQPITSEVSGSYCQHNRNDLVGEGGAQTAILKTDRAPGKAVKAPAKKTAAPKAAAKK